MALSSGSGYQSEVIDVVVLRLMHDDHSKETNVCGREAGVRLGLLVTLHSLHLEGKCRVQVLD